MKTLKYRTDIIEVGENAGETLYTCLAKYGRKAILELLKYYDIDDAILEAYHYRRLSSKVEEEAEYETASTEWAVTPSTTDCEEESLDFSELINCDDALNTSDIIEIDDTCWETAMVDCKENVLYDSEDDSMDSCCCHPAVTSGWARPNGRVNIWNYDMANL